MNTINNSLRIAQEIFKQIYLFNSVFIDYKKKNQPPTLTIELKSKLDLIFEKILNLDSELQKIPSFSEFYSNHYIDNNIEWTYNDKNIKELIPMSVHTFITILKSGKQNHFEYYFTFKTICKMFSLELINQMFQTNTDAIIVWKIIALAFILTNPGERLPLKLERAITYSPSSKIYSLSHGIIIETEDPKSNSLKKINFNTSFVKPFLCSFTILSCFKQILKEALEYNEIDIKVKRKTLKIMIEEYLSEDLIFLVNDFPQFGLTLADCSIILNVTKAVNYPSLASVMMTLYHEMTHLLYRKVSNTNFFRRSFDETEDSGTMVEKLLLGDLNKCHKATCHYILNISNYKCYPDVFYTKLSAIENYYRIGKIEDTRTYTLYKDDSNDLGCLITMQCK